MPLSLSGRGGYELLNGPATAGYSFSEECRCNKCLLRSNLLRSFRRLASILDGGLSLDESVKGDATDSPPTSVWTALTTGR